LRIDKSATVLVTGASGFLGQALLKALSKRQCNLRLTSRSLATGQKLADRYSAELVTGELSSQSVAADACEGITHIFHLAALGQYSGSNTAYPNPQAAIYKSNVEATRVLAECAARATNPPRFVYVSTAAVHGDTGNRPATEASPFAAATDYETTKLQAELLLHDIARLQLTILRPSAIVGPGDMRLLKLFRLANRRLIPILGSGNNRYQIIHVDDMARVLLAVAEANQAIGQTYACGNPETLRLRELLELIAQCAAKGKKPVGKIVSIPLGPIRALVSGLEKVCAWLGVKPLLNADRIDFFSANHWLDTKKLIRDFSEDELGEKDLDTQINHSLITHSNASAVADAQRWYEDQGLI